MDQLLEIIQRAIKAFENNNMSDFDEYATKIYNSFSCYPSKLDNVNCPYLLGVVYYYFEGALRENDNANKVCFENACYCFSRVIKDENIYEKQCAAMRLFLLLHDNGYAAFNLCFSVFQQNCTTLMGMPYREFKTIKSFSCNTEREQVELIGEYIKKVQSYCYSIFSTTYRHSSISSNEMERIAQLIECNNYECPNSLGYSYSKECFFDLFYKYLDSEVKMERGMIASRMTSL